MGNIFNGPLRWGWLAATRDLNYQDMPAENYVAFLDLRKLIGRPTTPVAEVFAAAVA
jgi:hypothetical protein